MKNSKNSLDTNDICKVIENLMTAIHGDLSGLNLNLFADFESMKNHAERQTLGNRQPLGKAVILLIVLEDPFSNLNPRKGIDQ